MARAASPAVSIPRFSVHIPGRLYAFSILIGDKTTLYVRRSVQVDLFSGEYVTVGEYIRKYGFTQTGWSIEEDVTYDGGTVEATIYELTHDQLKGAA
ncbi:hypothetical protein SEA_ARCHETTA_66 [Mycobacterium phage Archetta]|uniref:Uncharacterized protein n=2 Tax=Benedictvirus TaxID=2946819 RepID=A0A5Q2WFE6_9CAUD|nr:hypothetical protein KIP51_gp24 [Mycobacterium phage Bluefalcon]YP_010061029.1 hypothetical protein KIP52_gp16 [Mycobacterium phage Archetta]ATW60937.1 hypothetical protein SEA_ARCHETTA_66 [Mycobacterium phage Archetta]QGH75409.1 hypothetical protein SEA_BLUEFALCON_64 [Mycobacterium phage Bluefalcon]